MTQQEILDYNKRCTEFLGWTNLNDESFPEYLDKVGNFYPLKELTFDSDWNWIMEVLNKIQLLDIVHDYQRSYDSVFKEYQCAFSPAYKTHDFGYIVGKSKNSEKEAVVEAINQFLIWFKQNKK